MKETYVLDACVHRWLQFVRLSPGAFDTPQKKEVRVRAELCTEFAPRLRLPAPWVRFNMLQGGSATILASEARNIYNRAQWTIFDLANVAYFLNLPMWLSNENVAAFASPTAKRRSLLYLFLVV